MGEIVTGVSFDTIAREWRMKWSEDGDKTSLAEIQKVLDAHTPALKSIPGLKGIQRIVCGGCHDFKVIVSLTADSFGAWGEAAFAPEAEFLAAVTAIPGVSLVETQNFTIMPV
ncbi:hypothetical protein B484DRAFT_343290 [Ochromonadaceae sp. CCMP2298]|nr:hypothetical protein B484DRAFT_343290 [Ochromonadaceae sp. CCMP2298]|mmetsp:Transcript_1887/g.4107  ORF Transcript_1887/g.4107 Transcript_1887/m.4107 type:complete len:113 (+) Transcript_1887:59-397(+)|eukprot:CAMPEP_0173195154 /NCGR_PEP_ID=MMETSP1141-20130122/14894_1 /TAXON_ID=483371 /ORGANISM="non described non described, Strain CCMP2298" /LENGTH=112 /DNA_ID=CAMNT_0014119645 /DNA_START=30 /DNA_END=368 /DNA_ORIENTATION=+